MDLEELTSQAKSILNYKAKSPIQESGLSFPPSALYTMEILTKAINYISMLEELQSKYHVLPIRRLPQPEMIPGPKGSIDIIWAGRYGNEKKPYRILLNVIPNDLTSRVDFLEIDNPTQTFHIYRHKKLFTIPHSSIFSQDIDQDHS